MGRIGYYLKRVKGQPLGAIIRKAGLVAKQAATDNLHKFAEIRQQSDIGLKRFAVGLGQTQSGRRRVLDNLFSSPLANWPGCSLDDLHRGQAAADSHIWSAVDRIANQTGSHTFDILGFGPSAFGYETSSDGFEGIRFDCRTVSGAAEKQSLKMLARLHEAVMLTESPSRYDDASITSIQSGHYRPIDWHFDNKTGFRWVPDAWRGNIKPCSPLGADIKVPRELSRFQHTLSLVAGESGPRRDNAHEWVLQVLDWICANPLNFGVNWGCPMDVAIRMVNWIWGLSLLRSNPVLTRAVRLVILKSLYEHASFIKKNLEYSKELTNNHYLANITGLIVAGGAMPMFPESDSWLLFGSRELVQEMGRTVYPDGVSYEMSTAYHRLVTEMFLHGVAGIAGQSLQRRARLAGIQPDGSLDFNEPAVLPPWFYRRLYRMLRFTAGMTKPDGRVPVIGDNDNGRFVKLVPVSSETEGEGAEEFRDHRHLLAAGAALFHDDKMAAAGARYALEGQLLAHGLSKEVLAAIGNMGKEENPVSPSLEEPRPVCAGRNRHLNVSGPVTAGESACHLWPHGGFAVLTNQNAWAGFTGGPNGQNDRGGHNHNDKLSFELQVAGCDLVIDPGLYVYTSLPDIRNRFRATACHNTLVVPEREQNPFTDFDPRFPSTLFELKDICRCVIDAFDANSISGRHTGFGAEHFRRVSLEEHAFVIEDRYTGRGELYFHLAPGLRPTIEKHTVRISGLPEPVQIETEGIGSISSASCYVCPAYGKKIASVKIRMQRQQSDTRVVFRF